MTRPKSSSESDAPPTGTSRRRLVLIAAAALLSGGAALAGIYGIAPLLRNAGVAPACRPAGELARAITPLVRGEVAALAPAKSPIPAAHLSFRDQAGRERSIADWQGRIVLLNLWATWCTPCRKEMPALDELQAKLGGPDFEVVAVNIDTRDLAKPKAWLADAGIGSLAYYADPSPKIFHDVKTMGRAFGMPTTLLIDRNGCEIATLAGPAEWASDDATALIRAALQAPQR